MTQALSRISGRVLWVEIGDPFGDEDGQMIRRFLETRVAGFRLESEGPSRERIALGASDIRLVFVDRSTPAEIRALAADRSPVLLIGRRHRRDVERWAAGLRGWYVTPTGRGSAIGLPGTVRYRGEGGREVVVLRAGNPPRVVAARSLPGAPADPMDVEYLARRHRAAGVLMPEEGELLPPRVSDPAACGACHQKTFRTWQRSRHAAALEHVPPNGPRTCFGCHSTLRYPPPFRESRFAVGCASCHGEAKDHPPASAGSAQARCAACHTRASSPEFDREEYWKRIRCGD